MTVTRIAHVALWTADLDRLAAFYERVFAAHAGARYESRRRPGFVSRFITLTDGPAIEIMQAPWLGPAGDPSAERPGYAHIAIGFGSIGAVDRLAADAEREGFLASAPRRTGDGFYEAVLTDPDGNLIEITA
ncbi:glyoxalase/bleomycin resistance/extradiol dioxygenase family protein [Martelella lutilitoris]|uniref:Glyoxalase/bleomycin resistance/extradiol dioxygenase family protein n=1 Tax=Martelella lutilitoris TaxID=2583532 RepID=A0A5C4JZ63_9HYPH|nr:VOC family protein [Martelella lutilitoris]TNB49869.1 glyoxalase/bleomycin resistance/extradiol dioxygenase family protein [Martelella lutilitoris]